MNLHGPETRGHRFDPQQSHPSKVQRCSSQPGHADTQINASGWQSQAAAHRDFVARMCADQKHQAA